MREQTVMPNVGNMGMISALYKRYETLTDALIQDWLCQLYTHHLINPEYLFVSERGSQDLRAIVESKPWRYFVPSLPEGAFIKGVTRHLNATTGTQMHVVVLPTLPEKMLLVGNLVIQEEIAETPVSAK